MFPEERVTWGEERTLRTEKEVVEYLIAQNRSVLFLHGSIHTVISSLTASLYLRNNTCIPGVLFHMAPSGSFFQNRITFPMMRIFAWRIILEKGHLLGERKIFEMHDSENKALITALLRGWMRKQGSKELSLEHVLEQVVGIDCNVMQRLLCEICQSADS